MRARIFAALALTCLCMLGLCVMLFLHAFQQRVLASMMDDMETEARYLEVGLRDQGVAFLQRLRAATQAAGQEAVQAAGAKGEAGKAKEADRGGQPGAHTGAAPHRSPWDASRITWVSPDGQVRYDSSAAALADHSDRPEIRQAQARGTDRRQRFSQTLGQQAIFFAHRLSDGSILRLSRTTDTALGLLWQMWPRLVFLAAALLAGGLLASRWLAQKIVRPVNELDLAHPEAAVCYEEMRPLLARLTEQKTRLDAQMQVIERKQRDFEAVIFQMAEGLVLLDGHGDILLANDQAPRLLGMPLPVQGRLTRLCPLPELARLLAQAGRTGLAQAVVKHNGAWLWLCVNQVKDAAGVAAGCVLLCLDMTEKEERDALRRQFSATVSHELKTPLTTILAASEMLKTNFARPEDGPAIASLIHAESERMFHLVEDILLLSRLDAALAHGQAAALRLEPVNLDESLARCVARLEEATRARQVTITCAGQAGVVEGDGPLLDQLLFNLVENAVKYNRPGGTVQITATGGETGRAAGEAPCIAISDTGPGIPAGLQARVFERFYRVKNGQTANIPGSGLGLSIARHIAGLHGAALSLESEEGCGSTFTLRFSPLHAFHEEVGSRQG